MPIPPSGLLTWAASPTSTHPAGPEPVGHALVHAVERGVQEVPVAGRGRPRLAAAPGPARGSVSAVVRRVRVGREQDPPVLRRAQQHQPLVGVEDVVDGRDARQVPGEVLAGGDDQEPLGVGDALEVGPGRACVPPRRRRRRRPPSRRRTCRRPRSSRWSGPARSPTPVTRCANLTSVPGRSRSAASRIGVSLLCSHCTRNGYGVSPASTPRSSSAIGPVRAVAVLERGRGDAALQQRARARRGRRASPGSAGGRSTRATRRRGRGPPRARSR